MVEKKFSRLGQLVIAQRIVCVSKDGQIESLNIGCCWLVFGRLMWRNCRVYFVGPMCLITIITILLQFYKSALIKHVFDNEYSKDWTNAKILDFELDFTKRRFIESYFINQIPNTMNDE